MKATVEINLEDIFDDDGEQSLSAYLRDAFIDAVNKAVKDAVKNCPELKSFIDQAKQKAIEDLVTAFTKRAN